MDKATIIDLLKDRDKQQVVNFANYICKLKEEVDGNNKPVNYYLHNRTEQDIADDFNRVASEGMVFDGKHIAMTSEGISWDYVAYKNKMMLIYPETLIDTELVYEGDEFSYEKIDGKIKYNLKVKNPFDDKKDDKVIGGFCIIKNRRGEFITRLTAEDMKKHRALAIDSYYWKAWFQEMCKKTVIKKACKEHFEDDFKGVNEMDNSNYDITNPVNLDSKWKDEIDELKTREELATYWKNNQGQGKDFVDYLMKKKNKIAQSKKEEDIIKIGVDLAKKGTKSKTVKVVAKVKRKPKSKKKTKKIIKRIRRKSGKDKKSIEELKALKG